MSKREALIIVRDMLRCVVAAMAIGLVLCLALLWVCLLPLRLAMRYHSPKSEGVRLAELTALAALGTAALGLLRSRGTEPPSITKREWARRRRQLYDQRPDDTIPF